MRNNCIFALHLMGFPILCNETAINQIIDQITQNPMWMRLRFFSIRPFFVLVYPFFCQIQIERNEFGISVKMK